MIRFREEVRNMAEEVKKIAAGEEDEPAGETRIEVKEVMDGFFNLVELGVNIYNENLNDGKLSAHRLPEELLTLFLNFPGKRTGFCLTAPEKFVVFLNEEPDQVLVLGRKRQQPGTGESVLTKARQLIRITYTKSKDGFILKDNTGTILDPEEIILHIIRWAVSG